MHRNELLELAQEALARPKCNKAWEGGLASPWAVGWKQTVCRLVLAAKAAPAPEKVRTPDPPKPGNSKLELKL